MNSIIIGGRGTLGNKLYQRLTELGHIVEVIDIINEPKIDYQVEYKSDALEKHLRTMTFIKRPLPKLIIDLAEELMIDRSYQECVFDTNVTGTAHILKTCANYGIRCLLGTWKFRPDASTSPLAMSLYLRSKLPNFYNKGRAATQRMYLPHIINLDTPASNFGSLITRAYESIVHGGTTLLFEDGEYTHVPFEWISTQDAIHDIIQDGIAHQRSRNDIHIKGTLASFKSVIGILINLLQPKQSYELHMISGKIKNPITFFEISEGDPLDVSYIRQSLADEITRVNREPIT